MPRLVLGLIPYCAVLIGMYGLHSAVAAMGLYHLGMVTVLLVGKRGDALLRLVQGFERGRTLLWCAATLAAGPLLGLLWPYLALPGLSMGARLTQYGIAGAGLIAFGLWFSLINAVLEELFWRDHLAKCGALGDGLFGGYHVLVLVQFVHWPVALAAGLVLAVTGYLWRAESRLHSGLAVPLVAHLCADVSIIAAASLL